ncbi:unnamed protein product [Thlaspi arvense]|uniref:Defensin-like domain-containing protein n=1 Tax=Thlaspi arvense TaxID=13288 RepID=A0AAU9RRV8_THLAR|nr:unnamed protein product [Thlaspi arvense]
MVSLSNYDVLASGAETEKFSFDNCSTVCSDYYGWHECFTDCQMAKFGGGGECRSRSPKEPEKCCCQH